MSSASVVFSIQYTDLHDTNKFIDIVNSHVSVIQRIFLGALGFKHPKIERISFIDYKNKKFFPNFPFNKRLNIHNTSTLDKFGFGKYSGAFFDVIVRLEDNNPRNFRIFYEIDGVPSATPTPHPPPPPSPPQPPPTPAKETAHNESQDDPSVFVLGYKRKFVKKGRATYIEYDGKQLSLTEAKKLEKDLSKQSKNGVVCFSPPQ